MHILVDEYLVYLHEKKQVSANTFSSYGRDLKKFMEYLTKQRITEISDVTDKVMENYFAFLKENSYAASTITRNFIVVRSFFRYLIQNGHINHNPSEGIKLPKGEQKSNPNVILTRQEMESLVKQPAGLSFKELRDRAMLLLLYDTKISISELVNLKVKELDFQEKQVICKKGDNLKYYPFREQTSDVLKEHIQYNELEKEDWLFQNRYGKPMSRQGFWKSVKNYAKKAGIEKDISLYSIKQGEI